MTDCPYVPGKLYEIRVWDAEEEAHRWVEASYIGPDGDGDHTFHVAGTCQYESYYMGEPEENRWFDDQHVREKKAPEKMIKMDGWVNVYDPHPYLSYIQPGFYDTRQEADDVALKLMLSHNFQRRACVNVTGQTVA